MKRLGKSVSATVTSIYADNLEVIDDSFNYSTEIHSWTQILTYFFLEMKHYFYIICYPPLAELFEMGNSEKIK